MNSKRRAFLTSAVAGGLGIAVATRSEARPAILPLCHGKPSAADALESHEKFILELESSLIFKIFRETNESLLECNKLLRQLSGLVKELENEISKSGRAEVIDPVRRMRQLAEAGVRNGHAVKASAIADQSVYSLQFDYIADRVGQDAKELLPGGKNILSPNATRILNRILDLIKRSEPLREKLDEKQTQADKRAKEIRERLRASRDLMSNAGKLVDSAETQPRDKVPALRSDASANVTTAIENLEWIKTNTVGKELPLDGEVLIDALVTLLEGIVYWMRNPEKVTDRLSASLQIEKRISFIETSYAGKPSLSTDAPYDTWESVLSRLCKRDSLQQNSTIITGLIAALVAWRLARETAALLPNVPPLTLDEKLKKIEQVLRYWGSKVQTACGQPADVVQLAKALEPFI